MTNKPLDLALIAVVNFLMFLVVQSFLTTNYPDMNPNLVALIATFSSTFIMAYLFQKQRKKHD